MDIVHRPHKLLQRACGDGGAVVDAVTDTNPPVRIRFTLGRDDLSELCVQMVDAMNGEG